MVIDENFNTLILTVIKLLCVNVKHHTEKIEFIYGNQLEVQRNRDFHRFNVIFSKLDWLTMD